MNREAPSGRWPRARRGSGAGHASELWHKGATSGNVQQVRGSSPTAMPMRCWCSSTRRVRPATRVRGPAFLRARGRPVEPFAALADLAATVAARAAEADPERSYTASLLARGIDTVCKKVGEEATEVVLAAKGSRARPGDLRERRPAVPPHGPVAGVRRDPRRGCRRTRPASSAGHARVMTDLHMRAAAGPRALGHAVLEDVRELSAHGGQVALTHSWIADCETPVAAFLKLRDGGPAFLLESAEHGRLGRYSMIGVRPQAIVRSRRTADRTPPPTGR